MQRWSADLYCIVLHKHSFLFELLSFLRMWSWKKILLNHAKHQNKFWQTINETKILSCCLQFYFNTIPRPRMQNTEFARVFLKISPIRTLKNVAMSVLDTYQYPKQVSSDKKAVAYCNGEKPQFYCVRTGNLPKNLQNFIREILLR